MDTCNATWTNLPCIDAIGRTLEGNAYALTIVEPLRVVPPEGYRLDICWPSSHVRHTWVDPTIGDQWDLVTTLQCGSYQTFGPLPMPEPGGKLALAVCVLVVALLRVLRR